MSTETIYSDKDDIPEILAYLADEEYFCTNDCSSPSSQNKEAQSNVESPKQLKARQKVLNDEYLESSKKFTNQYNGRRNSDIIISEYTNRFSRPNVQSQSQVPETNQFPNSSLSPKARTQEQTNHTRSYITLFLFYCFSTRFWQREIGVLDLIPVVKGFGIIVLCFVSTIPTKNERSQEKGTTAKYNVFIENNSIEIVSRKTSLLVLYTVSWLYLWNAVEESIKSHIVDISLSENNQSTLSPSNNSIVRVVLKEKKVPSDMSPSFVVNNVVPIERDDSKFSRSTSEPKVTRVHENDDTLEPPITNLVSSDNLIQVIPHYDGLLNSCRYEQNHQEIRISNSLLTALKRRMRQNKYMKKDHQRKIFIKTAPRNKAIFSLRELIHLKDEKCVKKMIPMNMHDKTKLSILMDSSQNSSQDHMVSKKYDKKATTINGQKRKFSIFYLLKRTFGIITSSQVRKQQKTLDVIDVSWNELTSLAYNMKQLNIGMGESQVEDMDKMILIAWSHPWVE